MKRKLFGKRDIIILIILCAVAIFVFMLTKKESGGKAEIWIGGEIYRSYDLSTPFELTLYNGVTIVGDGEYAYFLHSDCDDKVCVNTGKLSVSGHWAACLPNETVLKIVKDDQKVDTVS